MPLYFDCPKCRDRAENMDAYAAHQRTHHPRGSRRIPLPQPVVTFVPQAEAQTAR